MIKSGLVSVSFRKLNIDKILEMCKKAQIDCIEWGGDIHVPHGNIALAEKVARMSNDAGIEIAAYGSYYFAGHSESAKEVPVKFEAVLDSALALGTKTIRVWAGKTVKSSEISDDSRKIIVDDLLRIGQMAAKHGIEVSMEFHNGTLTDTNESAFKLKNELPLDSNVNFYWQPPLAYNDQQCIEGIKGLQPRISNIHVFQWNRNEDGGLVKNLLETGKKRWVGFLTEINKDGKNHNAMLEFFLDDSEENFYKDSAVLKRIIRELKLG
jgi:sugar phosphate isomerase/epimerase